MRAVFYEEFKGPISVERLPDPVPPPGGVVIRVRATGLCRSDWHGWMGHDPDITPPHVPGHELAGVIEEVGGGVRDWQPGDRVTLPFVCGCGDCPQCDAGHQQVCDRQFQPGFTHWGSFAERVAVGYADVNLVRLPEAIDFTTAASLGCRFATSFRAVTDQGRVQAGQWVAVHGCGGVGLSAIMIASALGAKPVAVDVTREKLDFALKMGAVAAVKAGLNADVAGEVRELTGGGAHVSLDALGHAETCFNSIDCLRKRGRHVQVGLLDPGDRNARVPMDRVVARELELLGSHGMQAHRYGAMLEMILGGDLQPRALVGDTISLDDAPAALRRMDRFEGVGVTVIDRF